ncbi:MAG: hypothetical protein IPN46_17375 [Saprospiraceae bacterium]|nr:hypothetical protein [Saprospiraceae bacterium]
MISVVKFGFDDHKTYSLNILGRKEGAIQNLIFVETNGVISKPNIIEFQGTRKFVEDFNNRMVGFEKFEGTITQFTLQSFLNASRDDLIDCDCYKDYIKPVLVSPSYGDTNAGESSEQIVIQLNNLGFINLGHGATAIQTAGNHAVLTNLNNSINCPPGTIPVYYLGIKFCLSGGGGYAGGGWSNNGEQETFNNNVGSRTTIEECLNLTSGFGLNIGESNKIEPFTATNDPVSNQIRSCLNNPDILQKIEELNQNEIIDVCTNQRISNNAEEIALDLCFGCGKDGVGLTPESLEDAYYKALEGNPYIKILPSLATNCPKLNCILKNLLSGEGPSSDFLCDMISKFDGKPGFEIGSTIPKLGEPIFNAKTIVTPTGSNIGIVFNKNNCNSYNGINLFETFQHELVHADLYRQLIEDYSWNGDPMNFDETFKMLVLKKYGPDATPDEHVLMLNQILPNMINSLMQANGDNTLCTGLENSGPCFNFKTLILNGFSAELLETQLGISLEQHRVNADAYNIWKLSQPLFITLNNCK